jgi:hypothetical protein
MTCNDTIMMWNNVVMFTGHSARNETPILPARNSVKAECLPGQQLSVSVLGLPIHVGLADLTLATYALCKSKAAAEASRRFL